MSCVLMHKYSDVERRKRHGLPSRSRSCNCAAAPLSALQSRARAAWAEVNRQEVGGLTHSSSW